MENSLELSKETLDTLKNFATVNSNFYYTDGKEVMTKDVAGSIFLHATIPDEFPASFGIYNLQEFLSALSMFSKPDLSFEDKYVDIRQGKNSVRYGFSVKEMLCFPEKMIKTPSFEIEFSLTEENIKTLKTAASVLSLTEVLIKGDGEKITIAVVNTQNPSSNTMSIEVGETDQTFKAFIKVDNLKMIQGEYNVSLSTKKVAKFAHKSSKYSMYIALEKNSSFE